MATHGCENCCRCNGPVPDSVLCTIVTSPCPCIPVGATYCLHRVTPMVAGCFVWQTNPTDYTCNGAPLLIQLSCCSTCLHSHWALSGVSRFWFAAANDSERSDWTCRPFFQHWDNVVYNGDPACMNVPFSVEFTAPCP